MKVCIICFSWLYVTVHYKKYSKTARSKQSFSNNMNFLIKVREVPYEHMIKIISPSGSPYLSRPLVFDFTNDIGRLVQIISIYNGFLK